ncbi:DUF2963 domain-containing protein [Candidatus Phytoplasma australiense]|uniref:DUF2963 domain-containing protein n=1 Tax=Strawberry lethal yellows phytoplasma (CPA) str. NZSb11 TaxID=980422 RepID=R4S2E3_PHYAS|nr:DUF2963 domain-containing protein [Candidatus Phytoplasma australiense]AGL90953.1 Hypothetical Protein SLY_1039 [Strawberry lethal yellows phytoplasma (CPA) str. NZSb11]
MNNQPNYGETNMKENKTFHHDNGNPWLIYEYHPETLNPIKLTECNLEGKPQRITECDPQTGRKVKKTAYNFICGLDYIKYYDRETGKPTKIIQYYSNGKNVWYVTEWHPITGNLISCIFYNKDRTVSSAAQWHPITGQIIKYNDYNSAAVFNIEPEQAIHQKNLDNESKARI